MSSWRAPASNSSIFVDYKNDIGWVSDDAGHLYKITTIFTGTPTLASTLTPDVTNCSGGNGVMTAPVYDGATDTVFYYACGDGFLCGYTTASGLLSPCGGIQLARPNPGIIAPPIVDSTNHVLYAFYGQAQVSNLGEVAGDGLYCDPDLFPGDAAAILQLTGQTLSISANDNPNFDLVADGAIQPQLFQRLLTRHVVPLHLRVEFEASIPTGVSLQRLGLTRTG